MEEVERCFEETDPKKGRKRTKFQRYRIELMIAFATCLASFTVGFQNAWVTHAMRILTASKDAPFRLTERQAALVFTCNPIGSIFGAILSFFLVYYWSRSKPLIIAAIPDATAFAIYYFQQNFPAYCFGQFINGFGVSIVQAVSLMYAVEIASPELRGIIGILMIIVINMGTFTMNCLVSLVDFNFLTLCAITVPVCQFLACLFLPESPYLLLKKGKVDEARKVLQLLRNNKNVESEFKEMMVYTEMQFSQKITFRSFVSNKVFCRVVGYIGVLILCQHLTGYVAIFSFSQVIYSSGSSFISPELAGIVNSVCGIFFPFLTGIVVHKVHRTVQFMIAGIIVSGSLCALGVFYYFKDHDYQSINNWAFVPLASMLVYQFGFEMSYGPLVVLYMNEILPTNIRPIGACMASVALNIVAVGVFSSFVPLKEEFGMHNVLWAFGSCTIISSVIITSYFPETNGLSFMEILKKL